MTTRKKLRLAMMLAALACNAAGASACNLRSVERANEKQGSKSRTQTQTPMPTPTTDAKDKLEMNNTGELKELAAGGYSRIRESFIIVARDAETYASLKKLHDKLPDFGADFFKSNAVIAAFLGQRRSGGYGVGITREGGGGGGGAGTLRVAEKTPPKDAIVTMALTSAFQIVSVSVAEESPLALELDATWQAATRPYKVDAGEFTRMGGFAGRLEKSTLKGDIRIMRHAQLATVFFALQSASGEDARALQDVTTGTVTPDGGLSLTRLDPGSFIPPPRHSLRVRGKFSDSEHKLSLTLEALAAKVNDGYSGQGKLEATATAPAPPKQAFDEDDPM